MKLLVVLLLALLTGCAPAPAPAPRDDDVETDPSPQRVGTALHFAALAPLPPGARVTRLREQDGIDTSISLTVATGADVAGPWLAASGLPADLSQQRVANPDGAIVYRTATVAEPAPGAALVEVSAFTT